MPLHPVQVGRARAQQRLPAEVRQQLLDGINAGQSFRSLLRDLGLTPNQVWRLTKTDEQWSADLDAALTATRRGDLKHGTNAAYVAGCVCKECREHQRVRMVKNRRSPVTGQNGVGAAGSLPPVSSSASFGLPTASRKGKEVGQALQVAASSVSQFCLLWQSVRPTIVPHTKHGGS
jgi:hypothetical protein